ncbi:MAG: TM2 domain-containing protein [Cellvibrionales bacterium]|nr:TM2 domain-containing protein [Cellvibrionales bacterium]
MIIGYLLWLFGFTGSHRFYFGKPISGTIWFFTLGLLGIGWLIDIFLIPSMAKEADQRFEDGDINYTLAWVLLTFLGIFGAHRFYIGHYISGAVMLIITLSTMSLGWLVLPIPFFIGIPILIGFLIYDFWTLNTQIADKHRYSL